MLPVSGDKWEGLVVILFTIGLSVFGVHVLKVGGGQPRTVSTLATHSKKSYQNLKCKGLSFEMTLRIEVEL